MFELFVFLHRVLRALATRLVSKRRLVPRLYTNDLLKHYGPYFKGSVVNVSGWDDRDGEGGVYRDYFSRAETYAVTNAPGRGKGEGTAGADERLLDLSLPLLPEDRGRYDVVYNNTTLEHVLKFDQAFLNLCDLSAEAVIIIVPVIQQIHIAATYGDYWRPTTMALAKLFTQQGFTPLVIKTNDQPFQPIYAFVLAVRHPEKHINIVKDIDLEMGRYLYGSSLKHRFINTLLED